MPSVTENGTQEKAEVLRRHPRYWLEDGSLILRTQNDIFKVHRTLLSRHSPVLSSLSDKASVGAEGCPMVHIPDETGVASADLEALLEYLYHDIPLYDDDSFARIAAILRATSKQQLDFPTIHQLARSKLQSLLPSGPEAFLHPDEPDVALTLAIEHKMYSVQKALYYSLATNSDLVHDDVADVPAEELARRMRLSPAVVQQCKSLLDSLVDHFTPILFTVATASHMACTDVFAESWMPLVITPALSNNGLCRPLETLETIIKLDWRAQGICEECVKEKTEEWRGEQKVVWENMDGWLGLTGESHKEEQ